MKKLIIVAFVALGICINAVAAEVVPSQGVVAPPEVTEKASKYTVGGNLALLDTWVPMKFGLNFTYTQSSKYSWEFEYLRGSISRGFYFVDIGSITDERFTLLRRSFQNRPSFNWFLGLYYEVFKASLGSDFLAAVSGAPVGSVDLVKIATAGVTWGFGNRWRFKNRATLGVDWLTINVPLTTTESETDFLNYSSGKKREDVQDVIDVLEKIPTLGVLKLQLGYQF